MKMFRLKIRDRIFVKDSKEKVGSYKIVGRNWDHEKGVTYELKPEPTTAREFYRLFLKDEIIKKRNDFWTAIIEGSQFKEFKSRQVSDIGFVQW